MARAALVAAAALAPACVCSTPSAEIDGGDLMNVFSHDAGAGEAGDGGPHHGRGRRRRDAGADAAPAASAEAPAASVRAPIEGVCVTPEGAPDRDVRRTLGRPPCRGAQVLEWKDAEGAPRYACVV